jgi:hypothetical protein
MVRRWLGEGASPLVGIRRVVREQLGGEQRTHHDHLYAAHKAATEAGDHELANRILKLLRHEDGLEELPEDEDEDEGEGEEKVSRTRLEKMTGQESRARRPARGRGLLEGRRLKDMSDVEAMRFLRQSRWPW